VVVATFMTGHFELFGLDQVIRHFRGREPAVPRSATPGFQRYVRFPIQAGFIVAFWASPMKTTAGECQC